MHRGWQLSFFAGALFSLLFGLGAAAGQDAKKTEKKEDTILGKTIGEWIKILREHENPKFRRAALIALEYGSAASRTGLPTILEAVEKDKDPQVRREAVMVLGRLGPEAKGTLKTLAAALQNDKAETVRESAATALGNKKFAESAQDYVSVLADALKDPHAGTRLAAATALRNMGDLAKPAVPALTETVKNRNESPLVRAVAIHVISRQGKENSQIPPLLIDILLHEDNSLTVRESAAEGLGLSGSEAPEVIAALGKTLSAKSIELRKAASIALSTLGMKAKSGWPAIKLRLTEQMEPNSSVRNHLIRLTGVLAKAKTDAIPVLSSLAAKDDSTENRIAAIQELGELGALARESLTVLSNLALQDARAAVREAAEKAVKQIKGS